MIRRTDGKYYWSRNDTSAGFDNSRWSTWRQVPNGVFQSGPALTSHSTQVGVAGRGMDNRIYVNATQNAGDTWSGWKQVVYDDGAMTFNGDPAISFHGANVEVAARRSSNNRTYVSTVNLSTGWASEWIVAGGDSGIETFHSPGSASQGASAVGKYAVAITSSGGPIFFTLWD
jgi:hypothetical protein